MYSIFFIEIFLNSLIITINPSLCLNDTIVNNFQIFLEEEKTYWRNRVEREVEFHWNNK